jgi:predicted nucleic acid-binding Zn ribbon protein
MDSLNSLVPRALTELLRNGPLSQGKLDLAWRVAVGEALSRVSTAHLQPEGVVEVTPSDQRWQTELKRSSPTILHRLNRLLGTDAVRRLVVK